MWVPLTALDPSRHADALGDAPEREVYRPLTIAERPRAVDGAFTGREGGISPPPYDALNLGLHVGDAPAAVMENRRRALAVLSGGQPERPGAVGLGDLVVGQQVHGASVAVVGPEHAGRGAFDHATAVEGVDGLVTVHRGLCLCVLVADCVPLLLHDPIRGAIGAVHAGWRGTAAGIARSAVETMSAAFGCRPSDLRAALGPSIGPEDYEVGPEVIDAVGARYRATTASGRPSVDLRAALREQLIEVGLCAEHVEMSAASTASRVDRWFSHRAAGGAPTGRQAGLIALPRSGG